jgi:hypothetical protein
MDMKRLLLFICILFSLYTTKGQGFPNTDSLRTYNIKYITNNAATAFTNLRLHTLLRGVIDWIDTARAGTGGGGAIGIDTLWALNDSTIRYRKSGVFRNAILRGVYDTRRKVDTAYALNDSTLQIKINGTNRNIIMPGRHWDLQGILNNGSTLTDNETITLADSLTFTSGLVIIESLNLPSLVTKVDTTANKPVVVDSDGNVHKMAGWPGSGTSLTLNNVGTGYNWVTTPNGSIKRLNPGYGVLIDSTVTANSNTASVDTTSTNHVVTVSDLNDAVSIATGAVNPGIYISPAQSFDPTFVVIAAAIPHVTNSFSHGAAIGWEFLDNTSDHNSSFYDSVYANDGNGRLIVTFPRVRMVINTTNTVDETIASKLIHIGPTTAIDNFAAPAYRPLTIGVRLSGDGSGTWTKSGAYNIPAFFTLSTHSTSDGGTGFTINTSLVGVDYDRVSIVYMGPNNYQIKRVYSGLGGSAAKFILMDQFGNPVTDNPTSDDEIMITGGGMQAFQLNLATFDNNGDNSWLTTLSNFWISGYYECWLVASPISTTSTLVRWQTNYPSATNYKIYRSTTKYGARTLIHTGTEGTFTDTGLSTATLYFYHMVAVIGGVDTYITYFKTNTR